MIQLKIFLEKLVNWERWPMKIRYSLISPVWLWYCLRSGSFWFFTPSNPTISFGGFEGEGKREMYEQLPPSSYPKTIYINPALSFEKVKEQILENKFKYPFIVKPDVGMSGIMFRVINSEEALKQYHQRIPAEYIIQDFVSYKVEYSVFYYRFPNQTKGVITGFLRKDPLFVVGDGKKNLLELILHHPKAKYWLAELKHKHKSSLFNIIPQNEKFILSHAANLGRGGSFTDLNDEIDERLLRVFDELSAYSKTFYYGRYDLKADSVEDLKEGKNFSILEYNGSGAEPNHVYNKGLKLFQAYKEILKHWKVLYQISKYNRQQGIRYWPFIKGWNFIKASNKHFNLLKKYDTI